MYIGMQCKSTPWPLARKDQQNCVGKVKIIIFRFATYSVPCLASLGGLKMSGVTYKIFG